MDIDFNGEMDLHHFAPADTEYLIRAFIDQSCKKRLREIRIIHGKGRSAKKRKLQEILDNDPRVESWNDDGENWGATVITLCGRAGQVEPSPQD
ncbi:MAG: Smr/MutS family protein [Spirochaetota bacterium]